MGAPSRLPTTLGYVAASSRWVVALRPAKNRWIAAGSVVTGSGRRRGSSFHASAPTGGFGGTAPEAASRVADAGVSATASAARPRPNQYDMRVMAMTVAVLRVRDIGPKIT